MLAKVRELMNDSNARPRPADERDPAALNGEAVVVEDTATRLIGTDRYTMAEAAKLKNVSYHTVSRAVRAGRLPVQRLGRMALIAGDDLTAWSPMRERAPKRYRQSQTEGAASPVFLDASLGERLELARRLSTLYEIIHSASSELPLEEFSELVCSRMVDVFHLARGTLWLFDDSLRVATRVASVGGRMSSLADAIDLAAYPSFLAFAHDSVTRVSQDAKAEMHQLRDPDGGQPIGAVLALSLRIGGRTIGGFFGDRNGAPFELPDDHLVLARVLANQAALAIDHARLRDRERTRVTQLSVILDQLRQGVRACDEHGRLTFVNASDRRFSGEEEGTSTIGGDAFENHAILARYDLDGNPIRGDKHPLARALEGEHISDWEYNVVLTDGSHRRVAVNANPVMDDARITGAVYTARDLTEQRDAERQAAERLRNLEIAASRAEAVADIVSAIGAVRSVDAALEVTIRRMTDELRGTNGFVMLRQDDGHFLVSAAHGVPIPSTLPLSFEPIAIPSTILALASQEPTLIAFEDASVAERAMLDALGARFQLIVPLNVGERHFGAAYVNYTNEPSQTHIDMTFAATLGRQCVHAVDQIENVSQITARARRLLSVLDQLPQGVLIIDEPDAVVSLVNQAAQRLWGEPLAAGSLRAHDLRMIDAEGRLYTPDNHPLLRPFRTGGEYLGEPLTIMRPDGSQVDVLGNHAPIFGPDGSVVGGISVLQDREHFKPLDRAKDEFLSVVAHELRNPLTSLRGNLQLIQRRIRKRGEVETRGEEVDRLGIVIEQVDRISELVGRMLDISRVDLGRLDLTFVDADASAILRSVVNGFSGLSPDRSIRVSAPERLPVTWDQVRIEQILVNLLTNAVRYAPDGPIDVEARLVTPEQVEILVRDYGPGVPPRIQRRLFKQYYRFDDGQEDRNRTLDGSQGLGIGLYISARLARDHNGTLEVDDAEGGGAAFRLTLPRTPAGMGADRNQP